MAWVCSSCGGDNPAGMRFCGHCGTPAAAVEKEREAGAAEALRSFVSGQVADRLLESGGEIAEERRLVTALFADLSGFTPLADRLDPEELLEVIDPVIRRMTDIVGRYDGYVDKFAGDALLGFFGAPTSREDDADRALMVALEMHHELARLLPELPAEAGHLTLHIGVNTGHVIARVLGSDVRMDYSVLGDAVILAQRLESAAPAGETYVGMSTHALTSEKFDFENVGELTLKGKKQPVPAWRLIGPKRAREVARRAGTQVFVGRRVELAAIAAHVDRLELGRGGLVAVVGEPGVGKSRLKQEIRGRAEERGIRWLETRCLSYGTALAYWPYAELLREIIGLTPADPPDVATGRLEGWLSPRGLDELAPFFRRLLGLPDAAGTALPSDPEGFQRGLHEAFVRLTRSVTDGRPLVIAIEDLHWADKPSIALTRELVQRCAGSAVLVYMTSRPDGGDAVEEITRGLPQDDCHIMPLRPLDHEGVKGLIESILQGTAPRGLVTLIAERSAGNPFFAQETVRSLQESGVLTRRGRVWKTAPGWNADGIPPTVEGVLAARLDMLPQAAASVLQTASVIGRRVPVALLRAVAADTTDVDARLPALVDKGFLYETRDAGTETLVFQHALIQEVAYSRLLRRHRRELHRRVARYAEVLYGAGDDVIELLARHLYLGDTGAKAVDYLVRAASKARRLYANEQAIIEFRRAAELAETHVEVADRLPEIHLGLGDLFRITGRYADAVVSYRKALETRKDVHAWTGMATALRNQGDYTGALAALDEAFASDGFARGELARLWLERGWTLSVAGRYTDGIEALRSGLENVEGEDSTAGELLLQLAKNEVLEGNLEQGLTHALEAQTILEKSGDLAGLQVAMRVLGGIYSDAGRFDEAVATLRRGLELAERIGKADEIAGCLLNLGALEMDRGDLESAVTYTRRAIEEYERIEHGHGRAAGYANLGDMLMRMGELAEGLSYCGKALELAQRIGNMLVIADAMNTMAQIYLKQGDFREAATRAEEAARLFLEMDAVPLASESLNLAAEALKKADEWDKAIKLLEQARSFESPPEEPHPQ